MTRVPPCQALGRQCRELDVTLCIADLDEDDAAFHDEMGTWLLGHRQRITFGAPFAEGDHLLVDATLHVGCRYLRRTGGQSDGRAMCLAHGFEGPIPSATVPGVRDPKLGDGRFEIVDGRTMKELALAEAPLKRKSLPVLNENPCAGAPCRTADGVKGGACCRDLVLDVAIPDTGEAEEALLRARERPYISKVHRADEMTMECEIISACGYLEQDGVGCALHSRVRANGRSAKPAICFDWPVTGPDYVHHPGCRLV